ncbi:MAG: hypothetical protein ACLPH3_12335 [Terracidiphilus sp.]
MAVAAILVMRQLPDPKSWEIIIGAAILGFALFMLSWNYAFSSALEANRVARPIFFIALCAACASGWAYYCWPKTPQAVLNQRRDLLDTLSNAYIRENLAQKKHVPLEIQASLEMAPDTWLNAKLGERGESWTVEQLRGQFPNGFHPEWRHLTEFQKSSLADFGKKLPPNINFFVYAVSSSPEACAYGMEIWDAATSHNKKLHGSFVFWGANVQPIPIGLIVTIGRFPINSAPSIISLNLLGILQNSGLSPTSGLDYTPADANVNDVTLVVGTKPSFS